MACTGCNDCKCKEVDVVSDKTAKQLDEKLRVFNDLVCVIANTNCVDFPKVMGKAWYVLWCYLKDLTNVIKYILNNIGATNRYDDSALKQRIQALENKPDNNTEYDDTALRNRINELEKVNRTLGKIIANLEASGAWEGGMNGNFKPNRNIATGNINVFGGSTDGNNFIRTNNGQTDNDLAGGV